MDIDMEDADDVADSHFSPGHSATPPPQQIRAAMMVDRTREILRAFLAP